MPYCIYLRKSRADLDAEARGEGESLARHERTLLELAKRDKLNITAIYREIVSGDTIAARPVMQQLLSEVEQGCWEGVLVMEVERLARGDTIDQGIISQTFKYSNTKIITPIKTYNPNDEYDEEYFEFGLFMSRREYKIINRRLQRGRVAAVKEGKYVGNKTPYGYRRVRLENERGWTLEPVEDESEIVRTIFQWYTTGEEQPDGTFRRLGVALIVRRLNSMSVKPRDGKKWVNATIQGMLRNPVYIGKVRWNFRPATKQIVNGQLTVTRPINPASKWVLSDGLHPPIVDKSVFDMAQDMLASNPPRPIGERNVVRSPLAGLVICGKCGRRMVRRPYRKNGQSPSLMCPYTSCDNVSSRFDLVEERLLQGLAQWLADYKLKWDGVENSGVPASEMKRKAIDRIQSELDNTYKQLARTHDLLEQGVYDVDTFLDRSKILSGKIQDVKSSLAAAQADLEEEIMREENTVNIIPEVEQVLDVYNTLPTAQAKNDMLKKVIEKVVYTKEKDGKHIAPDGFELVIYPKIPKRQ